ncbi:MAG: type I methionyl aminopeptidase [Alphaproteobacteria bacterium TMED93]|nr:MAG: type I methionyl aminopeptidase [Alphaproteobacteria bacterium TMED93]
MSDYKEKFEKMRIAGKLAAQTLDMLTDNIKEGVSTDHIDKLGYEFIKDNGGYSAPLFYRGFKKSLCTSLNHVVCHGIPSKERILKDGDALNVDVTAIVNEHYGDTSRMFSIGKPNVKSKKLIEITYEAMWKGIEAVKPGNSTGDIGAAIQNFAENQGYSVVRDFCGHGIGQRFHTAPNILHYGQEKHGTKLIEGMFFTIEPMINLGKKDILILDDGWTAVTRDKKLSSQYEHTIGVTKTGYEVFTISEKEKKGGRVFSC